jgi:hypothetical protein
MLLRQKSSNRAGGVTLARHLPTMSGAQGSTPAPQKKRNRAVNVEVQPVLRGTQAKVDHTEGLLLVNGQGRPSDEDQPCEEGAALGEDRCAESCIGGA